MIPTPISVQWERLNPVLMWKERGELSYWTGSTESLINIHQWESNNISLYRSDLN